MLPICSVKLRSLRRSLTVNRVCRVRPLLVDVTKVGKVGGERVTIKVNDMLAVDRTNGIVHPFVKLDDSRVRRVCGLVQRVVPRDPLVPDVVLCELRPQPDGAVLKVLVDPKVGDVGAGIAMPVRVLSSGCGVEVEDGVNALLGTKVDDAVEVLKTLLLEYARVHIIWGRCWQGLQGRLFLPRDHLRNACS